MSDHPFAYERQEANAARAEQEYFDGPDQSEMTTLTCGCENEADREWDDGDDGEPMHCGNCGAFVEPS